MIGIIAGGNSNAAIDSVRFLHPASSSSSSSAAAAAAAYGTTVPSELVFTCNYPSTQDPSLPRAL